MFKQLQDLSREFKELERLFLPENQKLRQLVFYAESSIYFRYFEDYIEQILNNSDLRICYITSDPADKLFSERNPRIEPFFIKNLLAGAFGKLDSKVVVMTTPDLGTGIVKRAPAPVHHIYAFHGVSSTHQYYRPAAFHNYDSVLCIGQYQIDEIRRTESLYTLPAKQLILTGYPLVERLYRQHQSYKQSTPSKPDRKPVCLIAPSWWWVSPKSSIMENCIEQIIESLGKTNWDVWLRPHPEYLKRYFKRIKKIENLVARYPNITMQTELSSVQCMHEADILITDHSTIAMDFYLAMERPVLFVDTPLHVGNPEFEKVGMEPVENTYRSRMGGRIAPDMVQNIAERIESLISHDEDFTKKIPEVRSELLANWQSASIVGAEHILSKCKQ